MVWMTGARIKGPERCCITPEGNLSHCHTVASGPSALCDDKISDMLCHSRQRRYVCRSGHLARAHHQTRDPIWAEEHADTEILAHGETSQRLEKIRENELLMKDVYTVLSFRFSINSYY